MVVEHFCYFHDSTTTELYTYWHTLSLPDAHPISGSTGKAHSQSASAGLPVVRAAHLWLLRRQVRNHRAGSLWLPEPLPTRHLRSEEHTSELQSLMRISYVVFCLKKKKK